MESNVPMIAITIRSSISVKPPAATPALLRFMDSPIPVVHAVQPRAARERVHVIDVLARLRVLRRTLVAAQPPGVFCGYRAVRKKRVARDAAQEVEVDALRIWRGLHP